MHNSIMLKPTTLAAAFLAACLSLSAQATGLNLSIDPDTTGNVSQTDAVMPGGTVKLNGTGFKAGQQVKLLRGGFDLNDQAPFLIGETGTFTTEVQVPADATVGLHPVVVQVSNPDAARVVELKVSAPLPESGTERFDIAKAPLEPGVYQVGYGKRSNAVFVSSAVGRPPIRVSKLIKVNPDTLQIEKSVTPPTTANGAQLQAVYGLAVDDLNGYVWMGNTRTGSVGVYRQDDLSLVKQFKDGVASHSFGVAVDNRRGRAYVAAHGGLRVAVFDTRTLEELDPIILESPTRLRELAANPIGIAVDEENGKLYVLSTSEQVYVYEAETGKLETAYGLKGAADAMSIALAPQQQLLFVASQDSDNVLILEAKTGKILHDVRVGATPLAVTWDATRQVAYVASRGSDSIAVIDPNGKLVANLPAGSYPNHVTTDGAGNVFAVNKSRNADDGNGDHIRRIRMH